MASYDLAVVPLGGGAPLATFAQGGRLAASIGRVSWVLNQPGSMSFRAPLDHPATRAIDLLRVEVEVIRDDVTIWRGLPLQRQRSGGAADFTCAGLLWPFTRWHVGPNSFDFLDGRLRFTQGLTGWTAYGCTATATQTIVREGGQAALLDNRDNADADAYIEATFYIEDTGSDGEYVEVAADFFIDPSGGWAGPAFEERGLFVGSPDSLPDGQPAWEPITNSSPRGTWQRLTTGINLPPNLTNHPVFVRCYAPGARIAWDNGAAKRQASIGANQLTGTDAATVFATLANYGLTQKSDLGLTIDAPSSGSTIFDVYQMFELPNIFTLMESFPARGLLDFAVIDRTLTTFAPRRGSYKPAKALIVQPDEAPPVVSVLDYEHRADGAATASRVIRTGEGDGATREVFVATDTSATGGLILEHVGSVPPQYGPEGARSMAAHDLALSRDVVTVPSARVPAEGWLGELVEGDTTDVLISDGAVQEASTRRVVAVTLEPSSDTLLFDLAEEAEGAP